NQIEDIVVTAGAFEASDEKKSVVLKPLDIVTTAGGAADIYETMKMLPGTQQVGEQEGLFVRGGSANETVTIIDEMVVHKPFFSSVPDVPQRSRFQPFLFKGTMFSTGGYSSQYGQAMSSALILNSTDLADTTETAMGLNMAGANAYHAHRWDNTSLAVSAEYANLSPYFKLIEQRTDWTKAPEALNSEVVFRHRFSDRDMFKVYMLGSNSDIAMNYQTLNNDSIFMQHFDLNNKHLFINSSYKNYLSNKYSLFTGVSYTYDGDDIINYGLKVNSEKQYLQAKTILTRYLNNKASLKAGAEYQFNTQEGVYGNYESSAEAQYSAVFAELSYRIGGRFATRSGIRVLSSTFSNQTKVAPRLSCSYLTGVNSQVSVAYGVYYQHTDDSIRYQSKNLEMENAEHYIANYQWTGDERVFRVEAYFKRYHNLARVTQKYTSYDNSGYGYARGVDVFWRDEKSIRNSDYWISYSYIDTKRKYRNYPNELTPQYVSNHNASVVYKYSIPGITTTIGGSYSYASGRSFYHFAGNSLNFTEQTPDYHNLSISVSKLSSVFGNFAVFYAAVYNVLNRENILAYRYSPNGRLRVETGPTSLRSFFIGCFISIR
ncbi:MAG: hypothetical protein MI922_16315, partial [Bacteroidales bacterium]|nr:hypothetical protein [Bacteroidales bacterium]